MPLIAAALSGIVFGLGLLISGMALPAKVIGFLDIFGTWDPSLLFVMAAALAVSAAGYWLARQRSAPYCADRWHWPDRTAVDVPLVAGSVLFGLGWGLVGLCPGPALVGLLSGVPKVWVFVLAMAAGMLALHFWDRRTRAPAPVATADG